MGLNPTAQLDITRYMLSKIGGELVCAWMFQPVLQELERDNSKYGQTSEHVAIKARLTVALDHILEPDFELTSGFSEITNSFDDFRSADKMSEWRCSL